MKIFVYVHVQEMCIPSLKTIICLHKLFGVRFWYHNNAKGFIQQRSTELRNIFELN